jgi:hypothetical protein
VGERLLVNFFYANPVGHAVEALHYCLGYHAADPSQEIAVAWNAATATELADYCPWLADAYSIEHPFLEAGTGDLSNLPREWDWIVDDLRRHQDFQTDLFPGMAAYYAASDRHLVARRRRGVVGYGEPEYLPHQPLRFELPSAARAAAAARLGEARPAIALMPAGSSERALYPSVFSWRMIMDALPGARFVLVGRLAHDERTSTAFDAAELADLLAHDSAPIDCFDLPLGDQLATVEACDVFLSPHTGFGLAALAVGTPWLTLSGGRWFEYFFNHVPFRSILPDVERYPSFTQFEPPPVKDGRTPSMREARIREDLPRIITAAQELITGSLDYERAVREYFADLTRICDPAAIWSLDGVHLAYV